VGTAVDDIDIWRDSAFEKISRSSPDGFDKKRVGMIFLGMVGEERAGDLRGRKGLDNQKWLEGVVAESMAGTGKNGFGGKQERPGLFDRRE